MCMEQRVTLPEESSATSAALNDTGPTGRRWLPRLALPGIGLRASERRLLLLIVDLAVIVGALVIAILGGADWLDPAGSFIALWRWWATLAVLWWLMANLWECYDLARAASAPHSIISATAAAAFTVAIYQWIPLITPPLASRKLVLIFGLLAIGGLALWRGAYAVLFVQPNFYRRALVLGAGFIGPGPGCGAGAEFIGVFGQPAARDRLPDRRFRGR